MKNILPCPFCGQEASIREIEDESYNTCRIDIYYDIQCNTPNCFMECGSDWRYDTPEEVIKLWNNRQVGHNVQVNDQVL